jgi:hypothetical protein
MAEKVDIHKPSTGNQQDIHRFFHRDIRQKREKVSGIDTGFLFLYPNSSYSLKESIGSLGKV